MACMRYTNTFFLSHSYFKALLKKVTLECQLCLKGMHNTSMQAYYFYCQNTCIRTNKAYSIVTTKRNLKQIKDTYKQTQSKYALALHVKSRLRGQ